MRCKQQRCINIDWLEVFCYENYSPMNADFYQKRGFKVKVRDYGTPIYEEMFTVYENGLPYVEIRRNPYSKKENGGIFYSNACHVKLCNVQCYSENPVQDFLEFLCPTMSDGNRHNLYEIRGISRVDICLDFIKFDTGKKPLEFLKDYMANKYSKIGQSKVNAHGTDHFMGKYWNSVSWGSQRSMCRTKIYNKSLELKETGKKNYIKQAWIDAGLISDFYDETEIWRIEFSLNSDCKNFIQENGDFGDIHKFTLSNNLSTYDTREKLMTLFHSLKEHYFRFVSVKNGISKYKCAQMITFYHKKDERIYKPIPNAPKKDIGRTDRLLIKRIMELIEDHQTIPFIRHSLEILITSVWGAYANKKLYQKEKMKMKITKLDIRKDLLLMLDDNDFVDIFNTAFEEKLNKWMHDSRLQLDTRFAAEQLYNRLQEENQKRQEMAVQ